MPKNTHHRCNICGRDFGTGEALRTHVDKRHPREEDVRWWMVVEEPDVLPFER